MVCEQLKACGLDVIGRCFQWRPNDGTNIIDSGFTPKGNTRNE